MNEDGPGIDGNRSTPASTTVCLGYNKAEHLRGNRNDPPNISSKENPWAQFTTGASSTTDRQQAATQSSTQLVAQEETMRKKPAIIDGRAVASVETSSDATKVVEGLFGVNGVNLP